MPAITDLPIWLEDGFEIRTQGNVSTTPDTYTYNGSMQSYIFRNDGAGSITLTIGGNAVTVISGEMVTGGAFSSFTVVASSGTASWTMRAFDITAKLISQGGVDQGTAVKSFTFQNATSTNSNGTPAFVDGYTTLTVQTTISGTITINFEGSYDGITYSSIYGQPYSQGGNQSLSTSSAGTVVWAFNIAGLKYVQMRTSGASGSPSATAVGSASQAVFQWKPATSNLGANDGQQAGLLVQTTGSYMFGFNGTTWDRVKTINTGQLRTTLYNSTGNEVLITSYGNTDGNVATAQTMITSAYNQGFNGSTFDRIRVGKTYKYIEYLNLADNTATTVWTPASGKKFRLMAVQISSSAASLLHLRDGAGGTIFHTQRTAGIDSKYFEFGNGYLSATANNVLEILNKSTATINVWVTAWGTEE